MINFIPVTDGRSEYLDIYINGEYDGRLVIPDEVDFINLIHPKDPFGAKHYYKQILIH